MDDVVLIDRDDNVTGIMDKILAHKKRNLTPGGFSIYY